MNKTQIEQIKEMLIEKNLYGWKIELAEIARTNMYFTKFLEPEEIMNSNRTHIVITIYKDYGKEIGESSFNVVEFNKFVIQEQINNALIICDYSKKQTFALPEKESNLIKKEQLHELNLVDDKLITEQGRKTQLNNVYQALKKELSLSQHKDIKPNNLEIYAASSTLRILNSEGVDLSEPKTGFYIELTLTASKNEKFQKKIQKKEQEFVAAKDFSSTTQLDVKNFIAHNINMVRNILNSELIKTFNGNVILSGDAVSEFFAPHLSSSPLIMHSSAKIKHMGISRYQLNKPIGTFFRDNLSISTNPFMPLNPCSASFDHDGVLSKKVSIIEKGIFKNYLADKQYADYLNVPPTGAFGSVDISGGTSSLDKMYNSYKTLPYIEIVAFSSFVPNNISGDFSAEIRLGYIVVKDKQGNAIKTPFKGGLFTGNVFKLIENIYISKEIKEETGYKGPKAVMFENSVVAGIK
ncbi:hypothetical protein J4434_00915 [Candidatus Woesearchaeota archaeon]|nr:hypothetical protein [Candidatus Woesearchaeota archaeon]